MRVSTVPVKGATYRDICSGSRCIIRILSTDCVYPVWENKLIGRERSWDYWGLYLERVNEVTNTVPNR